MENHNKEFLVHMLTMSAQVIDMALDAMERKPDDMERKRECLKCIRTTAEDLRKIASSDTAFT